MSPKAITPERAPEAGRRAWSSTSEPAPQLGGGRPLTLEPSA